jgi:hypothetical protein
MDAFDLNQERRVSQSEGHGKAVQLWFVSTCFIQYKT